MKKEYFVRVHVKPYVYRWLMNNYFVNVPGMRDTISLRRNFELKSLFTALLNNQPYHADSHEDECKLRHRTCSVYINVGEHNFTHGSYNLTFTSEMLFASHLESIVKSDFVVYATFEYMFSTQLQNIVERYKELNGYSEDDWPSMSMIKILNRRDIRRMRDEARRHFLDITDTFFTTQLSYLKSQKRINHELTNR